MKKLLRFGLIGSTAVLMLTEPKFRKAVVGALAIAAESIDGWFEKLVARGEKASK